MFDTETDGDDDGVRKYVGRAVVLTLDVEEGDFDAEADALGEALRD